MSEAQRRNSVPLKGVIRPQESPRDAMASPKEMDVVRRAYELWQRAGEPPDKDQEFYHQAKKQLRGVGKRKPGSDFDGLSPADTNEV